MIRIESPRREHTWGILIRSVGASLFLAGLALSAFYLWQARIDRSVVGAATASQPIIAAQAKITPDPVSSPDVSTISIALNNSSSRQLDNLTVELLVRDEVGQVQLQERQGSISLPAGGSQTIYWEWRIPQRLERGAYGVMVNILDAKGDILFRGPVPLTSFRVEANRASFR